MITRAHANAQPKTSDKSGHSVHTVAAARRHLRDGGWSYRRAAPVLGVHPVHLAAVLSGRRKSVRLLDEVMALGPCPSADIPPRSLYRAIH